MNAIVTVIETTVAALYNALFTMGEGTFVKDSEVASEMFNSRNLFLKVNAIPARYIDPKTVVKFFQYETGGHIVDNVGGRIADRFGKIHPAVAENAANVLLNVNSTYYRSRSTMVFKGSLEIGE